MKTFKGRKDNWECVYYFVLIVIAAVFLYVGVNCLRNAYLGWGIAFVIAGVALSLFGLILWIKFFLMPSVILWQERNCLHIISIWSSKIIKLKEVERVYKKWRLRNIFSRRGGNDYILVILLKNGRKIKMKHLSDVEEAMQWLQTLLRDFWW